MKKWTTFSILLAVGLVTSFLVACGSKSGNGSGTNGNDPGVVPGGVLPPGTRVGFYAQNQNMNQVYPNSVGTSFNLGTNTANMRKVLREIMGVCDRNHNDGGLAACQAWMNGFLDVMIFANGSQASTVKLVIRAFPYVNCSMYYCNYYSYSLPSFNQFFLGLFGFNTLNMAGMYNPLVLDATINPVNNGKGFELRANPPSGATYHGGVNNLIHFRVNQGKLEDAGWDYKIFLNYDETNGVVASGHALRCSTQNCGVQGF